MEVCKKDSIIFQFFHPFILQSFHFNFLFTNMLEQVLQDYGLSAKEAKLYLVCLELGSAPASTIARRL